MAEPTGPPDKVEVEKIKKRAVKLLWKAIPCPDQNGRILRYLVRHNYELPNGTFAEEHCETSWSNLAHITLINLRPNTKYAVQVAGINDAGVGPFSSPIQFVTLGGIYQLRCTSNLF